MTIIGEAQEKERREREPWRIGGELGGDLMQEIWDHYGRWYVHGMHYRIPDDVELDERQMRSDYAYLICEETGDLFEVEVEVNVTRFTPEPLPDEDVEVEGQMALG